MPDLVTLYDEKDATYFSDTREPLLDLIDRTGLRVLDVGCAAGVVGKRLLETGKAKWVTGIELVPEQGEIARSVLNEIHVGNIEEMSFYWPAGQFDCFVLGDVLEHVIDPWNLLRRLRTVSCR